MRFPRRAPPTAADRSGDRAPEGEQPPGPVSHAAPGLDLVLAALPADRSCHILDLGPAVPDNVALLGPRAARLQIVDLLRGRARGAESGALADLASEHSRSFDLVLAWDVLDYLSADQAARVVEFLGNLCRRGSILHALIAAADAIPSAPGSYRILADGRLRRERPDGGEVGAPSLTPADVEKLLVGFRVEHAFVLSHGVREYVARRSSEE